MVCPGECIRIRLARGLIGPEAGCMGCFSYSIEGRVREQFTVPPKDELFRTNIPVGGE